MLESALKLSESRFLLFGAIAIDTVGMGALALLLVAPQYASSSTLLLMSLAVTAPVLALTVGIPASFVPKHFGPDERARRAVLAGTIMHMGVQANSLFQMLCGCGRGPASLRAYVLHTAVNAAVLVGLVVAAAVLIAVWRRWRNEPVGAVARAPDSEL